MKLSLVFALCAGLVSAEEGSVRKRDLASAGGSVNFPLCFSEASSVQVFGEGAVNMKDLRLGDRVFTGETYEPVYAFAHLDKTASAEFVQIKTAKGDTVEATGAHLIFVDGKADAVRAESIEVGDVLQGSKVTEIGSVRRTGLYAPLTSSGKLIVDGVKASSYVALEQMENNALFRGNLHGFSHFGISPFRLLCTKVSSKMCETYTENGVPVVLESIHETFEWFMGLPVILKSVAIAVYVAIAATTWTMECLLMTPVLGFLAAVAVGALASKAMGVRIQTGKAKTV